MYILHAKWQTTIKKQNKKQTSVYTISTHVCLFAFLFTLFVFSLFNDNTSSEILYTLCKWNSQIFVKVTYKSYNTVKILHNISYTYKRREVQQYMQLYTKYFLPPPRCCWNINFLEGEHEADIHDFKYTTYDLDSFKLTFSFCWKFTYLEFSTWNTCPHQKKSCDVVRCYWTAFGLCHS